ncbi:MAG: hypothetical protein J0I99_12225 [Devosia sp.]|uniref:hypothetical protein n=1 Tax=Devosia sp. TaxID=1871048 RepID=UPI001AC5CF79|nr:hypothetical protein [Devosia sp.]MBN9309362.1 hypothetical protein [Devosia sp.]MBN9316500.1 hypothetical protein [Devosia sp.]
MIVQKRTMNWLPRASVYSEMTSASEKRRAYLKADLASAASNNSALIAGGTGNTGESINLTLRIAAARIQGGTTKKV